MREKYHEYSGSMLGDDGSSASRKRIAGILWEKWWKERCPYLPSTPSIDRLDDASKYYNLSTYGHTDSDRRWTLVGFYLEPLEELFEMAYWRDHNYLLGLLRSDSFSDSELFERIMSGGHDKYKPGLRLRKAFEEHLFFGPGKFFKHVCKGEVDKVRAILNKKPPFDWLEESINTAFDLSKSIGRVGIHPDSVRTGRTPLYAAVQSGNIEMVKLLLSRPEIQVNKLCSSSMRSPLHRACMENNKYLVELLLSHAKIDKSGKDKYGKTPLHIAVECNSSDVVELLLSHADLNPNVACDSGLKRSPLHVAVAAGNEVLVEMLLANRAINTNQSGVDGKTAIYIATEKGFKSIVAKLLSSGADRNLTSSFTGNKMRPLDVANRVTDRIEIAEMLKVTLDTDEQRDLVKRIFTPCKYKLLTDIYVKSIRQSYREDFDKVSCAQELKQKIKEVEQAIITVVGMEYKKSTCDRCLVFAKEAIARSLQEFTLKLEKQDSIKGTENAIKFKQICEFIIGERELPSRYLST